MTAPRAAPSVATIIAYYERGGHEHYGEDVTQLAHALQCADLALGAGATDELVAAALLHDVGHLLVDEAPSVEDDHHEAVGARLLATVFGPGVAAPVALHVTAKRWRCAVDPSYRRALSEASRASLVVQGGPLGDDECARFESHHSFHDAVTLREWDDAAKDPHARTRALHDHEPMLRRLADRPATPRSLTTTA